MQSVVGSIGACAAFLVFATAAP
eukprot:COSAG02_NODE_20594_length_824_cov_0.617931_1_plen_22_part_10